MNYLKNRDILVTGAAGSIGSELCRQILTYEPHKVFALDQDETRLFELMNEIKVEPVLASIRDKERMTALFNENNFNVVFHAAAYKHVGMMELFPREAHETNVIGTTIVAGIARNSGIERLILISSDKAVRPNSQMGHTKELAEEIVRGYGYVVVRFGNVLNSRGSVFPIWRKQIEAGGPVTVTNPEMKRYFMSIEDACKLVIEAGRVGKSGEILALDMGEQVSILKLAEQMIALSGKKVDIKFTGARKGEKLSEALWNSQTEKAKRCGKLFVITKKNEV